MREDTMPMRMSRRAACADKRRASTLIELLVVIAVIGFLTALLLPSLRRSTEMASATVCRHHLRELGHSLQMYRIENDGWLPVVMSTPQPPSAPQRDERHANRQEAWFGKLFPTYMSDPGVLRCPRDPFGYRLAKSGADVRDPAVADFASYGINNFLFTVNGGILANVDRNSPKRPLDTILAADLGPDQATGSRRRDPTWGPTRNDSLLMWGDGFDPFAKVQPGTWVTTRHRDGIHMLTLAGGVRDVRTLDVLQSPIRGYYRSCAAGGCTLCNDLKLQHYTFAKEQLFWWTGPIPSE
jgi:type II secretory pathway pseudopilin PulG